MSSKKATNSYNFLDTYPLNEKKRAIVQTVRKSLFPVTPKRIAFLTKINHNMVKQYCRKLEEQGFIARVFRGSYAKPEDIVTIDSSMVGDVVPRVHCLRLRFGIVAVGVGKWIREFSDVVRITFVVHENRSATVFVRCVDDVSLDTVGFRLVLACVQKELRVSDDELDSASVVSYEFNTDFVGLRVDGAKAITLKAFDGAFWRVYNRGGFLRSEVKATRPLDVSNVLALMMGGVSQYNSLQLMFLNFQEMRKYVKATKFQNQLLWELVGQNRRLINKLFEKGVSSG